RSVAGLRPASPVVRVRALRPAGPAVRRCRPQPGPAGGADAAVDDLSVAAVTGDIVRRSPPGVLGDLAEVEQHTGLVADDLRVVPAGDEGHLPRCDVRLCTVAEVEAHLTRHAVEQVGPLAHVPAL